MVNLLITMRCNRNCSFCFAKEKLHSYSRLNNSKDITIHDLDRVLDFLVESGCYSLQLAGGEPTIHPCFDEILIRTLKRDMYVNVLSNALWEDKENALFSKIPPTSLGFLLNIDHPDSYKSKDWRRIEDNLSCLKGRVNTTLSFNIFEREPKCDYIFNLLSKYEFKKLRLSFSMPVVFGEVRNIHPSISDYGALAPFVMNFVNKAESLGALVKMDNTLPICMFSKAEVGELLLKGVLEPGRNFFCYPPIDIGPDLSIWRCFGTSGLFNKRLEDFNSLYEVYEYYERVFRPYQVKVFPMDECYECKYAKEGMCQGGCMGFSINRCIEMKNCPQEITDKDLLNMKPQFQDKVTMREYEIPKTVLTLILENKNILEIPLSMSGLLELFDGKTTLGEAIDVYMQKINAKGETSDQLDTFLTSLTRERVIPTIRRLVDREFLILNL